MDEQQIIDDMLDTLYGYDSVLKEDPEVIKAKKKEKEEKSEEMKVQINNICRDLEKELKEVFGSNIGEMKKIIRLQVLSSIKAEIDNGNSVVDANGKIGKGKIFDIIKQSKNEILDSTNKERKIRVESNDNIYEKKEENLDDVKNGIAENLKDMGISLSSDAMDELEKAIRRVREFLRIVQEKIDSGMTEEEAINEYFNQLTEEEQKIFMLDLEMVGKYELANSLNQVKEQEEAKSKDSDSQSEDAKENSPMPNVEEQPKKPTIQNVNSNLNQYYDMSRIGKAYEVGKTRGLVDQHGKNFQKEIIEAFDESISCNTRLLIDIRKTTLYQNEETPVGRNNGGDCGNIYGISQDKVYAMLEVFRQNDPSLKSKEFKAQKIIGSTKKITPSFNAEVSLEELARRRGGEIKAEKEVADFVFTPQNFYTGEYEHLVKGELITEHSLDKYIKSEGVDILIEEGMISGYNTEIGEVELSSVATTSAPISTSPPPPTPTSIVEDIDDSAVTDEGQSDPSKKGTLSTSTLKSLVESQAEARKMLEASEIIHGQTPERPTTGKTETQGAPVTDKDEKSGGGPEEH